MSSIPDNFSIVAVNSSTLSKTVRLPAAVNYPGRLLFIKDLYGTSGTNNIFISTSSSIDFIERGSTNFTNLNTNYQAITYTNDGINTWFLLNNYFNSLSTLSQNAIYPLGFSVVCTVIGITISATWTNSLYANYYSVSYYFNNTNTNVSGTLIQTVPFVSVLYNSIIITPDISYYYYAIVTAINTAGQTIVSSVTAQPIIFPIAPTIITLFKSPPYIYCFWVAQAYTISYNIKIYKTLSETIINGILIESASNIKTTYYQGSYIIENGYFYYASITAVNTSGESSNTISSFIFGDYPAQAPSSLIMSYINGIVSCSWSPGVNATSYTVYFYYTVSNTPSGGILVETDNTSATNQNLIADPLGGYNYYAEIISLTTYNITPSSKKTSDNIVLVAVSPATVENLSISIAGYYALATWIISANTITYTVEYYYNTTATTSGGTLLETFSLLESTATSRTSTTVLPNGYYIYVIVRSVNRYTSSSITSSSTTSLTQFPPTNPSNVSVSISNNKVIVSWTASSLYATSYTIVLYANGTTNSTSGGSSIETISGLTGTSVTTTSTLTINYYYATVTAYSSVSTLSSSTITSSSAVQYSALPQGGGSITFNSISGLTGGSITITSTALYATGYRIYISTTTNSANSVFTFTTTTTGSAVSFSGATLTGSTTYYAVLVPFNANGNSISSSFSSGITTAALPSGGNVTTNTFTTSGGSVNVAPSTLATSYSFYISGTPNTGGAVYSTTLYAARFNYTGVDQSYIVPSGFTSMSVILIGAGGTPPVDGGNGGTGGPGGLVSGTLATTSGETLTMIVGLSGLGYGGGGGNNQGYGYATGGGRAGIRRGATEIVTAGGGGGGGYTSQGGAGGGLTGGNGSTGGGYNEPWGLGGTQTVGGGRSDNAATSKGGQFFGGNPEITSSGNFMGGGGSGWYGGGGGAGGSSGGGGSSYVANITGTVVNTQGGGAPQSTNAQIVIYNGAAISYTYATGQFTITFSTPLSTGNTYYAILIPMNSNGSGIQFVSTGRTV